MSVELKNEKKWTPGPWEICEVDSDPDDFYYRDWLPVKGPAGIVANVGDSTWVHRVEQSGADYKNREANARLIAAAPDLYEALQQLHDAIEYGTGDLSENLQIARAALGKAGFSL